MWMSALKICIIALPPKKFRIIFLIPSNFYACLRGQGGGGGQPKVDRCGQGGRGGKKSLKKCGHPLWMAPSKLSHQI